MSSATPETENQHQPASEQTLIRQAQQGDRRAYDQLTGSYRPRLVGFCTRFAAGGPEAEDAAQEVLLLAWKNIALFRGEAAFSTWLYRIARNHCLNRLRGKATPASLNDTQYANSAVVPDPAPAIDRKIESRRIVAAVMERLNERDRIILWWYFQEEMTSEEISRRLPLGMKLSDDGVRSRLKRHIRPAIEAARRELHDP
jgi:RNA polymerase sigma-70 factor (ECF subfamily)